jgi:hypothetical protein
VRVASEESAVLRDFLGIFSIFRTIEEPASS